MDTIEYFKLQAKNLFKDFKTKRPVFDTVINDYLYEYSPQYFDIDGIVVDYDINEETFTLMKAQHVIANMANFNKWGDMLKAPKAKLEMGKLLFDHQDKFTIDDWYFFLGGAEELNNKVFDTEEQLALFRDAFMNIEAHHTSFGGYRIKKRMAA